MICRKTATVFTLILAINGRQVEFVHDVGDEPSEVIFRQPVLQRWRKEKQLIEGANPKAFVHAINDTDCLSNVKYFAENLSPTGS